MSLTIRAPRSTGLTENESHLPAVVQREFVNNFSGFSAIDVLNYETLGDQYDILLSPYFDDNAEAGWDLGHLPHTTHNMIGDITRTATGYALQMQVTRNADKMTAASYSETFTFAELDNFSGIRRASLELLEKMGVTVTERARTELSGAATVNHVNAQTALVRGITAQRGGTVVEALSYIIQAHNYDPDLAEAASRLNILSTSISSGNIGQDTRNDIAWRRQWVERLEEAETFFANYTKQSQPYYLVYDTTIKQGNINYQMETVELSFEMSLTSEPSWVNTINEVITTVETGLRTTGRAETWGLNWPDKSINMPSPFTEKTNNYTVVAEILNDRGQSIGRQIVFIPYGFTMPSGLATGIGESRRRNGFGSIAPIQWKDNVSFQAVDANLITDRLSIQVISIDGLPAEEAARQKKISVIPAMEFRRLNYSFGATSESSFTISNNNIVISHIGYESQIVIPPIINGVLITRIGRGSRQRAGLTSLTIPNSVTLIDDYVFQGNPLTSLSIPNSVKYIGAYAFDQNRLTSVTIPNSVSFIGNYAFTDGHYGSIHRITSITIGANVTVWSTAFDNSYFRNFYESNGRKPGTYTRSGNTWTYSPR